jgi:hypothetical protein
VAFYIAAMVMIEKNKEGVSQERKRKKQIKPQRQSTANLWENTRSESKF